MMEFLFEQRWKGCEYIGYSSEQLPVSRYDILKFTDYDDASDFRNRDDGIQLLATRSAYRAMGEGLSGNIPMVKRNSGIDVGSMVQLYHERLDNEQNVNNQKQVVMNDKNYEYLKEQVMYTGFREIPSDDLRAQMALGKKEFELKMDKTYGEDKVSVTLKFSRSDKSDLYFFNQYDVELLKQGEKEPMKQTFFINRRGSSITLKEAYNLLKGRAVHKTLTSKDDQKYDTWLQMDFKNTTEKGNFKMHQYSDKYGFDLEATLGKYPIKELETQQYKDALIDSIRKGNRQSVTFVKDGVEIKRFVEATPQFKGINFYDENNLHRVTESKAQSREEQQENAQKQDKSNQKSQQNKGTNDKQTKNEIAGEIGTKKKVGRRKVSA